MVVAALSSAVSPIARRYCAESTARRLAAVRPPVRREPGMNSRTLSRNSAPRAAAKSTIATRPGASSRPPVSLARNDVGVEPLLPLGQQRRARLVVDDVAALLPLRGRGEDAGLALERGGDAGLHVRGAGLEAGRELLVMMCEGSKSGIAILPLRSGRQRSAHFVIGVFTWSARYAIV